MDPTAELCFLTLLEPQSRFGDKPVKFQVVCPQNGTEVLKGLTVTKVFFIVRANLSPLYHTLNRI